MLKNEFLKKVIKIFFSNKKNIFLLIILMILSSILGFLSPLLNAKTIMAITMVDVKNILIYGFISLIVYTLVSLISAYSGRLKTKNRFYTSLEIDKYLCQELLELETKNFDKEGTDFFTSRTTSESTRIFIYLSNILSYLFQIIPQIGALIYLFYINIFIGIYFFITTIILIIYYKKRLDLWDKKRQEIYNQGNKNTSTFHEMIKGIRDVKVLNISNNMLNKIFTNNEKLVFQELDLNKENIWHEIISNGLKNIFDFLLLLLAIILIINSQLNGLDLIIIWTYKNYINTLQFYISYLQADIKELKLSCSHVNDILNNPKYPHEKFGNTHKDKLTGNIKFKKTTFKYNKRNILKQINLEIKPNETIGIVGESGSGKTTIFNLLTKLYMPHDNQIFLDDVDINKLDKDTIRNNISVITQDPYIFNMSIKDNLKLVKPNLINKEMIEKCEMCCLDELVNKLPDKYNTIVGEGGVTLSGGEKQRLAIARALLKESEIILLDEATSALDNKTQSYIQESIRKISDDYTILIIAHRLSTVKFCDRIIVLNDGEIVGIGTHQELLKNNVYYQNLYKSELK